MAWSDGDVGGSLDMDATFINISFVVLHGVALFFEFSLTHSYISYLNF